MTDPALQRTRPAPTPVGHAMACFRTPAIARRQLARAKAPVDSQVATIEVVSVPIFRIISAIPKERRARVEALDNATTVLAEDREPQPDLALRIQSEYGGQSLKRAIEFWRRGRE
jgi:hypothetical protein